MVRTYVDSSVLIAAFQGDYEKWAEANSDPLTSVSVELAARYDLGPLDALHVSAAVHGKAEEFVTLEKRRKPLGRVTEIRVAFLSET